MTKDVFSSEPYQKKNSKAFLRACQNGNLEEVVGFVRVDKYLVFDFDSVKYIKI